MSTSLNVTITTGVAAELFSLWMQNHGSGLDSLVLKVYEPGQLVLDSLAAAEQLCSLTLSCSTPWSHVSLDAPFESLSTLTRLSIDGFYTPTAPVLHSILSLRGLKSLTLNWWPPEGCQVSELFMQQLSTRLVELTYLDLRFLSVGFPALMQLRNLPDLKVLLVCETFRGADLLQLDALPITSVAVGVEGTTQAHLMAWLRTGVGHMQRLAFIGERGWSTLALHELPLHEVTQLQSLRIHNVQLSPVHAGISALAPLTQLTSLDLDHCGLDDAAVRSLSALSNLRHLGLRENADISGAQGTMEVLARSMPQLERLELHGASALAGGAALVAFEKGIVRYGSDSTSY